MLGRRVLGKTPGRRTTRDQRGAVAVEAALVLPLLVTMMFGIIELTMLVRDNIAVASAARVGVRAATTTAAVMSGPGTCTYREDVATTCSAGNSPAPGLAELAADAIQTSGSSMNKDTIDYILVYKANKQGYPGLDGNTTMPTSCAGYSSCVKFQWADAANAFRYKSGTWASTSVNACAGEADSVGVYLHITHQFLTGLFPGSIGLDDRAVGRFEPLPPDNCKSTSPFPHP
ncbi:TadE family protein [Nocardioides sp. CN2-186]|uniref:TadE/TadG family type IV pilus assembly protein n=1 Tax=Nocardioides tweenelious TaxID=3156607 RepID=UPI0032B40CFF